MNNRNIKIGIRLILLLAIDIFVVSRLEIGIYFIPHIYFLSLIMLPVRTSKAVLLLFGFFTGLAMDLFMNTGGLHAAATTMMAFLRILILRFYMGPEDEDNNISPALYSFGIRRYLYFSGFLILIHHLTFFSLEVFKADYIWMIVLKSLASTTLNILLLMFILMLFTKPAKKKNERRKR
jgi:rod shape-determining protein MreD